MDKRAEDSNASPADLGRSLCAQCRGRFDGLGAARYRAEEEHASLCFKKSITCRNYAMERRPSHPFTKTRAWRAFKLFYWIAVPILAVWIVGTYANNSYIDSFAACSRSNRFGGTRTSEEAQDCEQSVNSINRGVQQAAYIYYGVLALSSVALFYVIRQSTKYIIGRPDQPQ